jgi:hypothetical protein
VVVSEWGITTMRRAFALVFLAAVRLAAAAPTPTYEVTSWTVTGNQVLADFTLSGPDVSASGVVSHGFGSAFQDLKPGDAFSFAFPGYLTPYDYTMLVSSLVVDGTPWTFPQASLAGLTVLVSMTSPFEGPGIYNATGTISPLSVFALPGNAGPAPYGCDTIIYTPPCRSIQLVAPSEGSGTMTVSSFPDVPGTYWAEQFTLTYPAPTPDTASLFLIALAGLVAARFRRAFMKHVNPLPDESRPLNKETPPAGGAPGREAAAAG